MPPQDASTNSAATQEGNDLAGLLGLMMAADSARRPDSKLAPLLEARISPAAFDTLLAIRNARRSSGRWPAREELGTPSGAIVVEMSEQNSGLSIAIREGNSNVLRCWMSVEGEIVVPVFGNLGGTNPVPRLQRR